MNNRILLIVLLLLLNTNTGMSQQYQGAPNQMLSNGTISGNTFDSKLNVPIEYANIVLYSKRDSSQTTGTISDKEGNFQLTNIRPGLYYMKIDFMGYHSHRVDEIRIGPRNQTIDLGKIALNQTALLMEGVEVVAEKPLLEYKIDKKVINVRQQYTSISGDATQVLENVPSITVDIEGNVSLRGSTNFTVLIDNRPTVLEPSDALKQIPASSIDNIEIITNPSAKYDPDGTSGIINVITKKQKIRGESGIFNINLGQDEQYGGDLLLGRRMTHVNAYIGIDFDTHGHPGTSEQKNWTTRNDTTSYIYSDGAANRQMKRYGIRGGIDWTITNADNLSTSFRYGGRGMSSSSDQAYNEWTDPGSSEHFQYESDSDEKRGGGFYNVNLDYLHRFTRQGHELSGQIDVSRREGDEDSKNELLDSSGNITNGQQSSENGPGNHLRIKIDYKLPLRDDEKFECGYQSRTAHSEEVYEMNEYDPASDSYIHRSEFSHNTDYEDIIHSLYSTYSAEAGNFGYQAGFRGEYTGRTITLVGESKSFSIDRWDIFPTLHASYELYNGNQVIVSYTRRIERPRGWFLEPFLTWTDAYNVRKGNPDLKPEYIDSYEFGYQRYFGRNLFSVETYYRKTHNKIERVRSVYDANIFLHSTENVGSDYTLGTELMLNLNYFPWWDMKLMGNIYNYRIEGTLYDAAFSQKSDDWSTRFNNTFKLGSSTRFQINSIYNSPSVSAQGRREGFLMTNLALRQDFLARTLSITLQIRDIFKNARHEFTSEGPDFYSYNDYRHKSPIVSFTLSYNFNNHKVEREQRQDQNGEEFEGDEMF